MWQTRHGRIERRINRMTAGNVFAISDFLDIASAKTVSKTLTRLEEEMIIEKLMRGIYWKPCEKNGKRTALSPSELARAIARGNSWKLAPSGETALYLFGADKNEPTNWTYVTDGPYKVYAFDGFTISFKHTSGKQLSLGSEKVLLFIQVLKAYGKERLTAEVLARIRGFLKLDEIEEIKRESINMTEWMSGAVKRMLGYQLA